MKSPFIVEKKRQILAKESRLKELKKSYDGSYPEIGDLNTPEFWDEIYSENISLSVQDGMTKCRIKTVVSYIPRGKINLLDIGAGVGFIEELIHKNKDINIYGNDFSKTSVKILKKKFTGKYTVQSIYNLKYPKGFFDTVLVLEVLEHIPPSKIFNVLKSINKLMKREGLLIVSVPINEGLDKMTDNPSGHVRTYSEELIIAELNLAGFKIDEYETFFAFPNFYYLKSIMAKITRRKNPNNIVLKATKI